MKKNGITSVLAAVTAALGAAGLMLRRQLYQCCVDERGLLVTAHPLELALWGLTAAAAVLILVSVWKLPGAEKNAEYFVPSAAAAVGHIQGGASLLLTVLLHAPVMPGLLGTAWKVLGLLSGPCLLLAAVGHIRGRQPFFGLHLIPSLFMAVHVLNQFQTWSGNPQLMDYLFVMLGSFALLMSFFYAASSEAGLGNRRLQLGMGLAAGYFCLVGIPQSGYLYLYLGGAVFALCNLCSLWPKEREHGHEAA